MGRISKFLIHLLPIVVLILPSIGRPYIPPSDQIIEFMASKFANIKTLKVIQYTKIRELNQEKEKVFGEIIYLKSPYLYRSEMVEQPEKRLIIHSRKRTLRIIDRRIDYDGKRQDFFYRFLFLAQSPKRLSERLKALGIDLEEVSLTRFEGKIAYLIGEKEEESPKVLVDKDLFVPLLLKYGNDLYRFSNYRKIKEQAWYPYRIVYSFEGEIMEEYSAKEIMVNPPIDFSLFDIPAIRTKFGIRELGPSKLE